MTVPACGWETERDEADGLSRREKAWHWARNLSHALWEITEE